MTSLSPLPQLEGAVAPGAVGPAVPLAWAPGQSSAPVAGFPDLLSLLLSDVSLPLTDVEPVPAAPAAPEVWTRQPRATEGPKPPPAPATPEALAAPLAALAQENVTGPSTEARALPPEAEQAEGPWLAAALAAGSAIPAAPLPAPGIASPAETGPRPAPVTEPARIQPIEAAVAAEVPLAAQAVDPWRGSPERFTRSASAPAGDAPALALPAASSAAAELPAPPGGPRVAVSVLDGQSQTSPRPELPLQSESTGAVGDLSREPAVGQPSVASARWQPDAIAGQAEEVGDSPVAPLATGEDPGTPPEVTEPPDRGPGRGYRLATTWREPAAREGRREVSAREGGDEPSPGIAAAFRADGFPGAERTGHAAPRNLDEPSRTPAVPVERLVAGQVVERLGVITRDGHHRISLRLDPPELGAVRIDAVLHDRELTLRIRAELAPAREALEQALPWLRESLAAQGLVAPHVTVDLGLDSAPRGFSREDSAAFEGAWPAEVSERPRDRQAAPPDVEAARPALVDLWV